MIGHTYKSYIGYFFLSSVTDIKGNQVMLAGGNTQRFTKGGAIKSDRMKAVQRFLMTLVRKRRGSLSEVPDDCGSKLSISRTILSIWPLPFLGGIYFSTLSEKRIRPTLSLLAITEYARTAAISVIISLLVPDTVPNSPDRLTSISSITVSSRSSSKILTYGCPNRAVTFQSMLRISSPN